MHGTLFDFLAEANKLETGHRPYTLTWDGLTATARGYSGPNEVFAYLDRGDAGMGVRKVLDARARCGPAATTTSPAANASTSPSTVPGATSPASSTATASTSPSMARYDDVPTALDGRFFSVTVHAAPKPVPEPASALLIGISVGIMGLVLARRAGPDVHRAWRGQGPRREPFRPPRLAPCRLRLARIDPVALGSRAVCEVGTVEPRTLAVLIVAGTTPLPRPLAGAERLLTR